MRQKTIWTLVLSGLGIALAGHAAAKDPALANGQPVDFYATVAAVREVPEGNPLPGLHLDVKVKGRATDIYIAPLDFAAKFDIKVARNNEVHIIGTQVATGAADLVLARELNVGDYGVGKVFRAQLTVYLRSDDGPFWIESKPAPVLDVTY